MYSYSLLTPENQRKVDRQFIRERIDQLTEKLWVLTGDDYRRCKLTLDYNKRLLKNPKARVDLNAGR